MTGSCVIRERFMNGSRMILPRVGGGVGGVGVGGGCGAIHASRLTSTTSRPVDNATAATDSDRLAWMTAPRQIGRA